MDKSDIQELIAALYLRLNGYFSSGFIAHAPVGNLTEIDVLAVRFPEHKEPEREVEPCMHLHPPNDCVDFIVGEVKGGKKNPKFNTRFYQCPEAVEKVLNWIGAFSKTEIADLVPKVIAAAEPRTWRTRDDFPALPIPGSGAQLRLVLFAPDHTREPMRRGPAVYGDDMVNFIWKCLHPTNTRVGCAVDYNRNLWGHQFNALATYFKDWSRQAPGKIEDVYSAVLGGT
jgi:hypothetical protein